MSAYGPWRDRPPLRKNTAEYWDVMFQQVRQKLMVGGDQIFESEFYGLFNAGLFERFMVATPAQFEKGKVTLSAQIYEYCLRQGVERLHVDSLTLEQLKKPVFMVTIPDDPPQFLIDGHHRIVRLYEAGLEEADTVVASVEVSNLIHFHKGPVYPG